MNAYYNFDQVLQYQISQNERKLCFFSLRFAFEVQPLGDVSEYTATITDERTKDARKGLFRVKTLTLKAEGTF